MSWLNRFSNLFRGRALDRELDEELQFHLEARTRDNIRAGMSAGEAARDAARRFGNRTLARERAREANVLAWLESFVQDLRHGGRMFVKDPGLTAVAVISLALGTGANTAMFSAADAMLLRPLPVSRPSELVNIGSDFATGGFRWSLTSYPNYADIRDRSRSFQGVMGFATVTAGFAAQSGANPQVATGMAVSGNFFDVLGVTPQMGRAFRGEEDRVSGRDAVVVLSHGYWETLGSDAAIMGRDVRIGGIDFRVIGVAPESFSGPDRYERPAFYVPLMMWPRLTGDSQTIQARDNWDLRVKGRLKAGVSLAQAELNSIARDLDRVYPDTNRNQRLKVRTQFQTDVAENPVNAGLVAILTLLATGVLIIACANVAGLLTSRAPVRAREIALRMSIGAGRPRLIRQLLTESLLIAGAGGLLGLPVANVAIALLRQVQYPSDSYFVPRVELDGRVLAFSIVAAMVSAVLFGLLPAFETTRTDLAVALKTAGGGQSQTRRSMWRRHLLVATQVAVSLVLVTMAAFAYRMLEHELTEHIGFRTSHILIMRFDPSLAGYNEGEAQRFYERLVSQARATAGVESVTLASTTPIWSPGVSYIVPEHHQFAAGQSSAMVYSCNVDEHYFETLDIPIPRGRGFLATDTADAPRVAVVNQTLAQHYWPGQDPLGKRFWSGNDNAWVQIVGVARNSRYLHIGEQPADFAYFPYRQHPSPRLYLMAQSRGESASVLGPLRDAVRRLDANMPIYDVRTMEEHFYARATSIGEVTMEIVGGMGCMGVAIALAGLYGLISYTVSRRRREIGIRMAVGANGRDVLKMVLWQGVLPVIGGLLIGLALSAGAGRLLATSFPLSERVGPGLYGGIAPLLLLVATLAALIPARRAAQVDPVTVLRDE